MPLLETLGSIASSPITKDIGGLVSLLGNIGGRRSPEVSLDRMFHVYKRWGINPLAAVSGNTGGGTTIPLQNPFASIQPPRS